MRTLSCPSICLSCLQSQSCVHSLKPTSTDICIAYVERLHPNHPLAPPKWTFPSRGEALLAAADSSTHVGTPKPGKAATPNAPPSQLQVATHQTPPVETGPDIPVHRSEPVSGVRSHSPTYKYPDLHSCDHG